MLHSCRCEVKNIMLVMVWVVAVVVAVAVAVAVAVGAMPIWIQSNIDVSQYD